MGSSGPTAWAAHGPPPAIPSAPLDRAHPQKHGKKSPVKRMGEPSRVCGGRSYHADHNNNNGAQKKNRYFFSSCGGCWRNGGGAVAHRGARDAISV